MDLGQITVPVVCHGGTLSVPQTNVSAVWSAVSRSVGLQPFSQIVHEDYDVAIAVYSGR